MAAAPDQHASFAVLPRTAASARTCRSLIAFAAYLGTAGIGDLFALQLAALKPNNVDIPPVSQPFETVEKGLGEIGVADGW
ncbi:hypothetical protein [Sphingomonas sp. Leaf4]|uniref:hypothetical protein n=1 Tax=Sphingomonas sp. Leaf4 TaxID=2876553 RepID=UPI001E3C6B7A|nr:hypothetical protein [Sphingomonas sp. Leaf4]